MTPLWQRQVIQRLRDDVERGAIYFTLKARDELADLGLDESEALEILSSLAVSDVECRKESTHTGEWLYIFRGQTVDELPLYIKLVIRGNCVVVSFHERTGPWD